MTRFASKTTTNLDVSTDTSSYRYGFSYPTDKYVHITKPGLSEAVVKEISAIKQEPAWMLGLRLEALKIFDSKPTPNWGGDLSHINYDKIRYYLRPTDHQVQSWADVPADVKATFDKIGIPEAERDILAGVKAQYDSEVVYGSLKKTWEKDGVIFLSMDEGLARYPDLVKQYFTRTIPIADNKFSALNTAVWSGGSFVYIPPGVDVKMPLQTYFRINAANMGQFERTLIIVDEGAKVHYVEGCFTEGTNIQTQDGLVNIEDINQEDQVLTHTGTYHRVTKTQRHLYTGDLYTLSIRGNPSENIEVTEEHPILSVKRQHSNERNNKWEANWTPVKDLKKNDYVCLPIDRRLITNKSVTLTILEGKGKAGFTKVQIKVPSTPDLFRLIGYYLAEGSISSGHYLNFSFNETERKYIDDVKHLLKQVFDEDRVHESHHQTNHGISVVVRSTKLCRIFEQIAGTGCANKQLSPWILTESKAKQRQLILGWFRGDGNYFNRQEKHGLKENFRINTVSGSLARQGRQLLARLSVVSSLNVQDRSSQGRRIMHVLVIGGQYMVPFGQIVGINIKPSLHHKKRATYYHLDDKYLYTPISSITKKQVKDLPVYNFSVNTDESYVAGGIAVHNCTAPAYASSSLHSAVVEIFVKKGARCQYTTVQNWYKNVYNLVTKRAWVDEEAEMIWTDFNMGSRLTMKYPGFILAGKGARGQTLSMAMAGAGQHQDTGSKAIHLAPYTSSTIISKSISVGGGRTSYRGLVQVAPQAHHSKNMVVCDALLLDSQSRSDTYPTDRILNSQVEVQHEASVSKIGEDQLFYLMSRGITEEDARKMIVNGFVEDLIRKLPLEYAVEMNRLIDHEMEGSIG